MTPDGSITDTGANDPALRLGRMVLTSTFSVELPGIEPGAKIALSWENLRFKHAKRRETT